MRKEDPKILFENLTDEDKFYYLQKAKYLIEYNYIMHRDIEELAIEIYSKRRVKQS